MSLIQKNLKLVQEKISNYESKYHREPGSVELIAVTKQQSIDAIIEAFNAGQKKFAENFVQEALGKIDALKNKSIEWHFIGVIQANKTKKIAENFAWVHSISRKKIATRLNKQRPKELPVLNVCIEVNIAEEKTKSGVRLKDLESLANHIKKCNNLRLRGLMVILPIACNHKQQLALFQQVKTWQEKLNQQGFSLDTLSMGMTNDYEAAIAAGSTMVRIGTAIFGKRQ